MTAVVSRERAKATWLTGVAGLLILAAAWAMMVCAAPSLAYPRPHPAVTRAPREVSISAQITQGRLPTGRHRNDPHGAALEPLP